MGRIRALDGLRGIAIILVVLSHVNGSIMFGGGVAGVTLFFVLSGFLITNILTRQADAGGIRFANFYTRRVRRLLPALVVAVAGSWFLLGGLEWWSYAWPTLTYTANYQLMAAQGMPVLGYLGHTWSLAVEEHFYLLWPLVVAVIPTRWRLRGVVTLAGTAMLWRGYVYFTEEFHRVYLGTDTNAAALLAGCALAVTASRLPAPSRRLGLAALAGLVALSTLPYVAIREPLTFLMIPLAALAVHSAPAVWLLEVKWLAWFGTVSYGLYLWHPILFQVMPGLWMMPVSVLAAWLSWKLIEQPVLNWKPQRPSLSPLQPVLVPA